MRKGTKIAILGDVHLGSKKDSISFSDYIKKFYDNVFFPTLKKHGIKTILQTGDFFDSKKHINFRTLANAREFLIDRCEKEGIHLYILIGNHDIYWKDSLSITGIGQILGNRDHITIIDEPSTYTFGKFKFDIVPWICKDNQEQILDYMKKSESEYLIGHFDIIGFEMYQGFTSEHGFDSDTFRKYKEVFSGHYHTRSKKGNINYVGTPYEITWSDCEDPKSFIIFDTEDGTQELVENPYHLFNKIIYNDKEIDYNKVDVKDYSDSYIKITVVEKEDEKMFERFIDRLYELADPIDISIIDLTIRYQDEEIENIQAQDPLSILIQSVDDKRKDAPDIRSKIQEIYNETLSKGYEE